MLWIIFNFFFHFCSFYKLNTELRMASQVIMRQFNRTNFSISFRGESIFFSFIATKKNQHEFSCITNLMKEQKDTNLLAQKSYFLSTRTKTRQTFLLHIKSPLTYNKKKN